MAGSADHPLFPDDSLEKGCRGTEEALRGTEEASRGIEESGSWKFQKILGLLFLNPRVRILKKSLDPTGA